MKRMLICALLAAVSLTGCAAQPAPTGEAARSSAAAEVILYSLPEDTLGRPLAETPYYREGELLFLTAPTGLASGHGAWRASPLDAAMVCCRNLYAPEAERSPSPNDAEITWDDSHTAIRRLDYPDGLSFARQPSAEGIDAVVITLPESSPLSGELLVDFTAPADGDGLLCIRSIVYRPL